MREKKSRNYNPNSPYKPPDHSPINVDGDMTAADYIRWIEERKLNEQMSEKQKQERQDNELSR